MKMKHNKRIHWIMIFNRIMIANGIFESASTILLTEFPLSNQEKAVLLNIYPDSRKTFSCKIQEHKKMVTDKMFCFPLQQISAFLASNYIIF